MSKKPESRLTRKILIALKEEYSHAFFFKAHGGPFQLIGIPDIVGCVDGRFVAIEVKRPGKEDHLTEAQSLVINHIKSARGISGVATSVQEALDLIEESG